MDESNTSQAGGVSWTLVGGASAMQQQPVFIMAPPPLINMATGTPSTEVGGGVAAMQGLMPQFLPPGFTLAYSSGHFVGNSVQDPPPTSPSPSPPSSSPPPPTHHHHHHHQSNGGVESSSSTPRPGVISPPLGRESSRDKGPERKMKKRSEREGYKRPVHVSVVSPVARESGHKWADPAAGTLKGEPQASRRSSVIMGVSSPPPTRKEEDPDRNLVPFGSPAYYKMVAKTEDTEGDAHRSSEGEPSHQAAIVAEGGAKTGSGLIWSPPEGDSMEMAGGPVQQEKPGTYSQVVHSSPSHTTRLLGGPSLAIHSKYLPPDPKVDLRKRRGKKPTDIEAFLVPLRKGWRRETMIRSHTKADVCYTTPCGRRLRAYQEVTRYLELNVIKELTVDNFSFSTKILVGQFLEAQGDGSSWRVLTDSEVAAKNLTVDKRLLGCRKRRPDEPVTMTTTQHELEGNVDVVTPTHPPPQHASISSHTAKTAEVQPIVTVAVDDADPQPSVGAAITYSPSDEVVGGGHTTIVTVAPTTDSHTEEAVAMGNQAETPTVVIDGVSSSGSTDALVTMPTTVRSPSYSPTGPSSDVGGLVVYPRKRGRKRKSELGSSGPIHVPRQRGRPTASSSEQPEPGKPKRRGRPPKVLSQSMQAMTSQFEAHSMQQLPAATAETPRPDVGYSVPVTEKRVAPGHGSGDSHMTSSRLPPSMVVVKKRVGRPRKADVELRKKEAVRLRAEKVRKKAEKLTQEKVMRRQLKKQLIEVEQKRKVLADLTAKRREADDLERRRSRVLRFQWQELRRRQLEHSHHLVERNRQSRLDYRARLEQQKKEFEIQYQLKKPVEDLVLKGMPSLSTLPLLPTLHLSPTAFGQAQVVFEFMAAFTDFLKCEDLPSFPSLCSSLHNVNPKVFTDTLSALLGALVRDRAGKLSTASGWPLKDMEITAGTATELFRILTMSSSNLPGHIADVVSKLDSCPIAALPPSQKVAILSFLVDELLESPSLVKEIDSRMELMSSLRREKWKVNLKLKRFRTVFNREHITAEELVAMAKPPPYKGRGRPPKRPQVVAVDGGDSSDDDETQDGDGDGDDLAVGEDVSEGVSPEQSDEEMPSSRDTLETRIKQMRKKQARIRSLIHHLSRRMRSFPLGSDRYTRTYWSLPTLGGVYVEGVDCYPEANLHWGAIEVETEPMDDGNHGDGDHGNNEPVLGEGDGVTAADRTGLIVQPQTGSCSSEGGKGAEAEPGPSHLSEGAVSHDSSQSPAKRKKPKPHPLVLNSHLTSQSEGVAMATEGPLSPSSTPVTITIHSPTGVGTVSGTMEVVPVSTAPSKRSSVITSAVEWSRSAATAGGSSDRVPVKETPKAQPPPPPPPPPSIWFHLLPRDPCNMPCNLQRLIDQCSDVKDKMGESTEVVAMETATGSGTVAKTEEQPVATHEQSSGEKPDGRDHTGDQVMPMSQYSYMYVQTSSGDTQLCLVENSSMPYLQSVTLHMEVPPVVAMANEAESIPYAIPITVEASPLPIHHHNLQRMVAAMERGSQHTPDELLKDVADDVKCGWRFVQMGQEVDNLIKKLSCRGYREKGLYKSLTKHKDHIQEPSGSHGIDQLAEATRTIGHFLDQPKEDSTEVQLLVVHKEVVNMAERLVSANLQEQGRVNPIPSPSGEDRVTYQSLEQLLAKVQECLLAVEEAVDRQNLNPPFQDTALADQEEEGECDSFLSQWKQAVSMATSASQLSVCMVQLERSIAWEKSLLKVFCTVCHQAEDEACLLLCDSCNRGTHTYCCRPRLDCIPDGDWFCAACASSAIVKRACAECGGRRGATTSCSSCSRSYHKKCLPPSAQNRSKSDKWRCPHCSKSPSMQTRNRGRGQVGSPSRGRGHAGSQSRGRGQASNSSMGRGRAGSPSLGRSSPAPDKLNGDELFLCRSLVRELERQPQAMPFRYPVSKKQFPEYYEMIQLPMDFQTIKTKLKEQRYVSKWEFADDVEVMFRNCSFFNEDTSEVGRAGRSMKKIFDEKWLEFFPPND